MSKGCRREWSEEEVLFLKENRKNMSLKELANYSDRTINAIKNMLHKIQARKHEDWTKKERAVIRDSDNKTFSEIALTLNRTEASVAYQAKKMGIRRDTDKWTRKEDKIIIQQAHLTDKTISKTLNRSVSAIKTRRLKLIGSKCPNWTKLEEKKLLNYVKEGKTNKQISELVDKTEKQIKLKKLRLGIKKRRVKRFSEQDLLFMKNNQHATNSEIARLLKRDKACIFVKRQSLGWLRDATLSNQENIFVLRMYPKLSIIDIADYLETNISCIRQILIDKKIILSNRDDLNRLCWSKKVYRKDDFMCCLCGSSKNICAHHLNSYDWCVDERETVKNGVTLCEFHHKDFHFKYGYGKNTEKQFLNYVIKEVNR